MVLCQSDIVSCVYNNNNSQIPRLSPHLISAIAVFRYQNSRILDTNILHLIHGSVLSSVSVFAMSVRVHKLHFNKEVDGLIYKIIETEEEIKQCFELYQNSFLKGLMQ